MRHNSGFSVIEILIAIMLISAIVAMSISKLNLTNNQASVVSSDLLSGYSDLESAFGLYFSDKAAYPTGLADTTFVPLYLMVPKAPNGFDTAYGVSGYLLALRTGQASPNNGYYLATRVTVSNANDVNWKGILTAASKLPSTKFYYNTTVPAITNMAAPAASTVVYVTYWINRY